MEQFQKHREEAMLNLKIADHLFTQTYTVLKEPKLLLSIINKTYKTQIAALNAVLEYETLFKRAKNPEEEASKIQEFEKHSRRLGLTDFVELVRSTKGLLNAQKDAPIEFRKNESLILCDKEFNIKKISESTVKENISKTKKLVEEVKKITSKNEAIFR